MQPVLGLWGGGSSQANLLGGGASPAQKNPAAILAGMMGGGGTRGMTDMNGNPLPAGSGVNGTGSGGSQATGGFMGGQTGVLNNTQRDPQVDLMQKNMAERYKKLNANEGKMDPYLQESINNLRNRQSTNTTQRAMDQANAGSADQTAGLQSQMASQAARTGRGSGWGGAEAAGAGQRLAAKQNAQIQMNELGRQDNLTLQGQNILRSPSDLATQQSGQTNNFLLGAGGQANMAGNLALGQQGLGLEQWKAGTDANYKQALLNKDSSQDMFNNYLRLMQTMPS